MDFRKAFFPTQEELNKLNEFFKRINEEGIKTYIEEGMSREEAEKAWGEYLDFNFNNKKRGYYS